MPQPYRYGVESGGVTPGGRQDRFPGFDVLALVDTWDPVTAGAVLRRLGSPPALRFFNLAEQAVGTALFDLLLDQREPPRLPVLEMIDARLAAGQTDGWRYADMPEDGPAFQRSFAALDEEAAAAFGVRFADLEWFDRTDLVQRVHDMGSKPWRGLPAGQVWSLWTRYACTAFYAHPWAWNEIGFGGPAYPRGYRNAGVDAREPWEVRDRSDRDPIGWGERVEQARRRHAGVRSAQLARAHPGGPPGVGADPTDQRPAGP